MSDFKLLWESLKLLVQPRRLRRLLALEEKYLERRRKCLNKRYADLNERMGNVAYAFGSALNKVYSNAFLDSGEE